MTFLVASNLKVVEFKIAIGTEYVLSALSRINIVPLIQRDIISWSSENPGGSASVSWSEFLLAVLPRLLALAPLFVLNCVFSWCLM